jgi:subtilisin
MRSYRPFGQGSGQASNFAIAKAIDRAVTDGCDLINLSLAGRSTDIVIAQAIAEARDAGCLPIAAAGNDFRAPIGYPAADRLTIGVGAMGRVGTFPHDAPAQDAVAAPFGTDANDFVAAFSNVGPEITFIGPGVAILSTTPGGYAAKDGTSMACPAVTGATARMLAQRDDVRTMPRNRARSDAMEDMARQAAMPLGFGSQFEGHGRIA